MFLLFAYYAGLLILAQTGWLYLHLAVPVVLTPLLIGLLVAGIGLSLGGPTGYAINPARDLGPRIIHAIMPIPGKGTSDWEYAWVPVVGPLIGGALGALAYDWWWPS